MPFFIVGRDTSFERIAGNLLRSGVTPEAVTDLRRTLLEANPGLDLDRLAPGTVIDVPRRPGVQVPSGDGSLASTVRDGIGGLQGELKEQLALIAQVAEAGLVNAASERDETLQMLGQQDVNAAFGRNPALAQALKATLPIMAADREETERTREVVRKAVDLWSGELAALDRLAP